MKKHFLRRCADVPNQARRIQQHGKLGNSVCFGLTWSVLVSRDAKRFSTHPEKALRCASRLTSATDRSFAIRRLLSSVVRALAAVLVQRALETFEV